MYRVVKYTCPANSLTSAFTATETQIYEQRGGRGGFVLKVRPPPRGRAHPPGVRAL